MQHSQSTAIAAPQTLKEKGKSEKIYGFFFLPLFTIEGLGQVSAMNAKHIARETARTLQSYLTYQAVRTIAAQLRETNPSESIWLSHYSAGKMQDGEAYLEGLMLERKDLVLRILTVREDIAESVLEFLPEMVKTNIQQANGDRRRAVLERLTQVQVTPEIASEEIPQENSCDNAPADLYREQFDSEAREE